MITNLLIAAIVMIVCVALNKLTSKLGIPVLLVFILLGMAFGSDGPIKIQFDNYTLANELCTTALIFIMFYGGFGTKWKAARPVAARALLLSTVGVTITAGLVGLFCRFILGISWSESLLLGSVISSTDAASVFSILRSRRLNLKYNLASLLEMESGSNDPCSYMLTAILLSAMSGSSGSGDFVLLIFSQIVYGVVCGVLISLTAYPLLKKLQSSSAGFDSVFVLAVALLSYAVPSALGGNGYLSAYLVGIVLGNRPIQSKPTLVHFFDGITSLMQILIFFLLGLLSFPSQLPQIALPALAIALFLTFVARPAAVFSLLTPFHVNPKAQLLVAWSGLRGAASIVFAIMTILSPAYTKNDIFHIVLFIVLFSILLQGTLLPVAARRLDMIDDRENVMKTFSDYTDELPIRFIQFTIKSDHPWAGKKVSDLVLPPDTMLVSRQRDGRTAVPNGRTTVCDGDTFILSAKASNPGGSGILLTEVQITPESDWLNKQISEIALETGQRIFLIRRGNRTIIPQGQTKIRENDILVINRCPCPVS